MADTEVPEWQGKVVSEEVASNGLGVGTTHEPNQVEEERRLPLRVFLLGFLSGLLLLGMAIGGYVLARVTEDDSATSAASGTDGDGESVEIVDDQTSTSPLTDTDTETDSEVAAPSVTTEPETTTSIETTIVATEPSDWNASLKGQVVTLKGRVPDEEFSQYISAVAAGVLGEENVINEFEIDPSVFVDEDYSAPVVFEDVVLFEFGSVTPGPDSQQVLGIMIAGMTANPTAEVDVVTYTDSSGSAEFNQELATLRAEAIRDIMVTSGIEERRIVLDPRGEEDGATDDEPEELAAQRRRAEFTVRGLLNVPE